jgi:hypothetical protein
MLLSEVTSTLRGAKLALWFGTSAKWGIRGTEGIVSSVVLTPVTQSGYWRVKIARPKVSPRYVGKFRSREEAEKWIEKHCWPTQHTREPDEP